MAQQPHPQYEFHYQKVEFLKTESLGIGSYGAVCKAMCDDFPCAAKILHPTLFQFTVPEATSVMRKFEQECHLLSAIKHPHIVQYLGTYHDPESRLPMLLLELMDESLTRFLEQSCDPLPYYTEVNLCHNITLALSYLHSNGIVHRDLSTTMCCWSQEAGLKWLILEWWSFMMWTAALPTSPPSLCAQVQWCTCLQKH